MDTWRNETTQALQNDGFNVTYAGGIPQNLTGYDLVVIEAAWGAVHPSDSDTISNFVDNGGGVCMFCITPCFFIVNCTDRWPYRFGGTDLSAIADWFGYNTYFNLGGSAYPSFDHPLGTSLLTTDQIFYTSGSSAASVNGPVDNNTQVVAQYQGTSGMPPPFPFFDSSTNSPAPFAFTHTFGAGRVYWQAHMWPF
jgi:hypothetical protein